MISHTTAKQSRKESFYRGFTIVELVVSLAIIGILLAILIPAVQQAREAARLASCRNNMRQIGVAIHNFESERGIIPPLSGIAGVGGSYLVSILPQMDQTALFDRYLVAKTFDEKTKIGSVMIRSYICPSDSFGDRLVLASPSRATNYAGNYGTGYQKFGYNGFFRPSNSTSLVVGGPLRFADISDGLSNTVAVAEILSANGSNDPLRSVFATPQPLYRPDQLEEFASVCANLPIQGVVGDNFVRGRPWVWSDHLSTYYNHILTPNHKSCLNFQNPRNSALTSSSAHHEGVNVLLADGSVDFISESIDLVRWRNLGSREGD